MVTLFNKKIKFAYTIFYYKDVAKTVTFYETTFSFNRKLISDGNSYPELITGHTTLSFAAIELAKTNLLNGFIESNVANKPFAIEIGFTVDNVDKTVSKALKANTTLVEQPKI